MGDIAEGSGVNEGGRAVGSLDEIGKNSFGEQRHHSAGRAEVAGAHGASVASDADDDGIQAFAQILPASSSPPLRKSWPSSHLRKTGKICANAWIPSSSASLATEDP